MILDQHNSSLDKILDADEPNFKNLDGIGISIRGLRIDAEIKLKNKKYPHSSSFVATTKSLGEGAKLRAVMLKDAPIETVLSQLKVERELLNNDFCFSLISIIKSSDRNYTDKTRVEDFETSIKNQHGIFAMEDELESIRKVENKFNVMNFHKNEPDFSKTVRAEIIVKELSIAMKKDSGLSPMDAHTKGFKSRIESMSKDEFDKAKGNVF